MTLLDLIAKRRAVCDAATPGPWVFGDIKDSSGGRRGPDGIGYLKRTGAAVDLSLYGNGEDLSGPVVLRLDCERYQDFPNEADARLLEDARQGYPEALGALAIAVRALETYGAAMGTLGEPAREALDAIREKLEAGDA
jgi:hypothetical protein